MRAGEGKPPQINMISTAPKGGRALGLDRFLKMRRFNFAVSCIFACLVFFSGVAPGNYDPPPNFPLDLSIIPRAEAESAAIVSNPEPGEAEELSAEVPAGDPTNPKKPTSLERARAALAESSATALSDQELCTTLVEVARSNDLPLGFFTNLIWRESRFDHDAISPVGAMGIAQFMPDVAEKLSLDAFDSRSALPASGRLLRVLRARFGNLGLAAAAYNAGPKRVLDWLERRSTLPKETQDYVYLITGRPAALWQNIKSQAVVYRVPRYVPCHRLSSFTVVEQGERTQQELVVAEEVRLAEQRIREAARRQNAEKEKRKAVARVARVQLASRVQATKSVTVRRQAKIQLAQAKR